MAIEIHKTAAEIIDRAAQMDPEEHNMISEWTDARGIDNEEYGEFIDQVLARVNDNMEAGMVPSMAMLSGLMLSFQVAYETAANHFAKGNPLS